MCSSAPSFSTTAGSPGMKIRDTREVGGGLVLDNGLGVPDETGGKWREWYKGRTVFLAEDISASVGKDGVGTNQAWERQEVGRKSRENIEGCAISMSADHLGDWECNK
ncbi:hypothetical protein C8F01DRAFT_1081686 [Mycena amicta]|nr:hypothetical protein C8F01DRAFT_1081686 [Mycena amicta]